MLHFVYLKQSALEISNENEGFFQLEKHVLILNAVTYVVYLKSTVSYPVYFLLAWSQDWILSDQWFYTSRNLQNSQQITWLYNKRGEGNGMGCWRRGVWEVRHYTVWVWWGEVQDWDHKTIKCKWSISKRIFCYFSKQMICHWMEKSRFTAWN